MFPHLLNRKPHLDIAIQHRFRQLNRWLREDPRDPQLVV